MRFFIIIRDDQGLYLTFGRSGSDNNPMHRAVRLFLVHLCVLTLVMPLGWCCWLIPAAKAADAKPAGEAECCQACCNQEMPAPASPAKPVMPKTCPCDQRSASLKAEPTDFALVAVPDLFAAEEPYGRPLQSSAPIAFDATPLSLQILHCVWLC